MSFADARQIQTLVENLLNEIWSSQGFRIDLPFPIISYEDSLALASFTLIFFNFFNFIFSNFINFINFFSTALTSPI
jgi:hypothetical protein